MRQHPGFTLIEVLVTCTIIVMLTMGIYMTNLYFVDRATDAASQENITQLAGMINNIKILSGKTLAEITGSTGSSVNCVNGSSGIDARSVASFNSLCVAPWTAALDKIADEGVARGLIQNKAQFVTSFTQDANGMPYLLDENEGQYAPYCNRDVNSSGNQNGDFCGTAAQIATCMVAGGSCDAWWGDSGSFGACMPDFLWSVGVNKVSEYDSVTLTGKDMYPFAKKTPWWAIKNGSSQAGPAGNKNANCTGQNG